MAPEKEKKTKDSAIEGKELSADELAAVSGGATTGKRQ